jgi:hypothetical protein
MHKENAKNFRYLLKNSVKKGVLVTYKPTSFPFYLQSIMRTFSSALVSIWILPYLNEHSYKKTVL